MWSAFWLQSDNVGNVGHGGKDGAEIDVYESSFIAENRTCTGSAVHVDAYDPPFYASSGAVTDVGKDLYDGEFHTYALLWTPEMYVFYVDGEETWRTDYKGRIHRPRISAADGRDTRSRICRLRSLRAEDRPFRERGRRVERLCYQSGEGLRQRRFCAVYQFRRGFRRYERRVYSDIRRLRCRRRGACRGSYCRDRVVSEKEKERRPLNRRRRLGPDAVVCPERAFRVRTAAIRCDNYGQRSRGRVIIIKIK